MTYNNTQEDKIQQEILNDRLSTINEEIDKKQYSFNKIRLEIDYLKTDKQRVEKDLEHLNNSSIDPSNLITEVTDLAEFTSIVAQEKSLETLRLNNDSTGKKISDIYEIIKKQYSNNYNNLTASRVHRAVDKLKDEEKVYITNPDQTKFRRYAIKDNSENNNPEMD